MYDSKNALEKLEYVASQFGGTRHQLKLFPKDRESLRNYGFKVTELSPLNQKKACICLVDWGNPEPGTVASRVLQMSKECLEKGYYKPHIN